jgi:protein-S-isoprenylcysteine O-methyltransferase Ste14
MTLVTRRFLANVLRMSAIVIGIGSVALFAFVPLGTLAPQLQLSDPTLVLWDTGLSLFFFFQHSGMVRRSFRARLATVTPPEWGAAIYAVASGIALTLVALLWQVSPTRLLVLEGTLQIACWTASIAAIIGFALGFRALKNFDLLGLKPLRAELKGETQSASVFVVTGPYRWVRHPLYSCVLVLIWANPNITVDRLAFSLLWSIWIVIGAWLEERDLANEFGDVYRAYQRRVPFLLPWRRAVR